MDYRVSMEHTVQSLIAHQCDIVLHLNSNGYVPAYSASTSTRFLNSTSISLMFEVSKFEVSKFAVSGTTMDYRLINY